MSDEKKVFLANLKDSDKTVFASLLSILSLRTDSEWQLVDSGLAHPVDIVIVDVDEDSSVQLVDLYSRRGIETVAYGEREKLGRYEHALAKPFRASDVLDCLKEYAAHH